jgi:hypothetical protein
MTRQRDGLDHIGVDKRQSGYLLVEYQKMLNSQQKQYESEQSGRINETIIAVLWAVTPCHCLPCADAPDDAGRA